MASSPAFLFALLTLVAFVAASPAPAARPANGPSTVDAEHIKKVIAALAAAKKNIAARPPVFSRLTAPEKRPADKPVLHRALLAKLAEQRKLQVVSKDALSSFLLSKPAPRVHADAQREAILRIAKVIAANRGKIVVQKDN